MTIIAVGDIMMGTTYPTQNLPANQGKDVFTAMGSFLQDADLALGNLEGVFLVGGESTKKVERGRNYAFRMPPYFAQNLVDAGFDFVNLANNHMNDFGHEGITSTIEALNTVGLQYGGPDGKIGQCEVEGIQVAIVSFATSPRTYSLLDIPRAQHIVAELARHYDIVIVSVHGGGEGTRFLHTRDTLEYFLGKPRGNVVQFAKAVIDSGADFIWGHGPHVPRALEVYHDRLIAYSLGNFCTWGFNLAEERGYAPVIKVVLDSTGIFMHGGIISAVQNRYPTIDSLQCALHLIRELSTSDFPNSCPRITDDGMILPRNEDEGQ